MNKDLNIKLTFDVKSGQLNTANKVLQNIIREKISDNKDNHIVYFMRAGFYYRAVLKRAINKKSKDEIYLSSLIRSSKEIKK